MFGQFVDSGDRGQSADTNGSDHGQSVSTGHSVDCSQSTRIPLNSYLDFLIENENNSDKCDVWSDILLDVIDNNVVNELLLGRVLTLAVSKSQNDSLANRVFSCKLLTKLCRRLPNEDLFLKTILPAVIGLSNDVQPSVRAHISKQLSTLSQNLSSTIIKTLMIPVLTNLTNDSQLIVRIAAIESTIELIPRLDKQFVKETVLPQMVVFFGSALIEAIECVPKQEKGKLLREITRSLMVCEETINSSLDWRLHISFFQNLTQIMVLLGLDSIKTNFLPLIMKRIVTSRAIPIRIESSRCLLCLFRDFPVLSEELNIYEWFVTTLCYGKSCSQRMLFLNVCQLINELCDHKIIIKFILEPMMSLCGDKVPNIRLNVCKKFRAFKSLHKSQEMSQKLDEIKKVFKVMLTSETDRDVIQSMIEMINELNWRSEFDSIIDLRSQSYSQLNEESNSPSIPNCLQTNGTTTAGTHTMMKNGVSPNMDTRHQCITCLREYESKSLEELRLEDYTSNRKGPQQSTGMFGNTGAVSSSILFGTTSAPQNAFSSTTSTGLFGQNKPSFGTLAPTTSIANSGLFGQTFSQNKPLFGTSTENSVLKRITTKDQQNSSDSKVSELERKIIAKEKEKLEKSKKNLEQQKTMDRLKIKRKKEALKMKQKELDRKEREAKKKEEEIEKILKELLKEKKRLSDNLNKESDEQTVPLNTLN